MVSKYNFFYIGNKQVIHEGKYPYTSSVGSCKASSYWNPGAKIVKAHADYNKPSDDKIMKMVYKYGAVTAVVDASGGGWGQYKSGVYNTCGTNV